MSEIIISKLDTSIELLNEKSIQIKSISIVGGVAKNNYINKKLQNEMLKENIKLFYPIDDMMTDNAAMIAWSCIKNFKLKKNDIFFKPDPRMKISENL